jgi:putative ATPase
LLRATIEKDKLRSMIFYGPAGTGKTTLAEIIAHRTDATFLRINATNAGVKDIRSCVKQAKMEHELNKTRTVVFIDEIHRFSKNVQDALLPSVEDGTIVLVGATTENPYFAVNGPLVSRSLIFQFNPLTSKDLLKALQMGVKYYSSQNKKVKIDPQAAKYLVIMADGDARKILTALEFAVETQDGEEVYVDEDICRKVMPHKSVQFDRSGDEHFDLASAYQGSIQASDPDAAIYWLARWIESGEDIVYIGRRMFVAAAEDVGIGDPTCMSSAWAAYNACKVIGLPECALHLATATVHMATSPRNKSAACAFWTAQKDVKNSETVWIPPEMRDSHYKAAAKLGLGAYHDGAKPEHYVGIKKRYYKPEEWEPE